MGDREPHCLHLGDHRRGRCCATRGDLHRLGEVAPDRGGRVDQHRQHDRRATHMRHAEVGDRRENLGRIDPAQADMRPARQRHRPGVGPAVAVKHRQGPQIHAGRPQREGQRIGARVQIGAAMMRHHTLRIAGRAGGVIQRDRLPFVIRQPHLVFRIAGGEEGFIVGGADPVPGWSQRIIDIDDQRRRPHLGQGTAHHG